MTVSKEQPTQRGMSRREFLTAGAGAGMAVSAAKIMVATSALTNSAFSWKSVPDGTVGVGSG